MTKIYIGENSKYEFNFESLVGKGSYGEVYKVTSLSSNNQIISYAFKKIDTQDRSSLKELEILKKLEPHKNLITFIDCVHSELNYGFIFEYCGNGSLRKKITEKRNTQSNFEQKEIYRWAIDIIRGINHLHKSGIIHKDIKPENILIGDEFEAKLCDFGISTLIKTGAFSAEQTCTGRFTPAYKSPEMETFKYDYKTDIWSAGCVIYELLTLQLFQKHIRLLSESKECVYLTDKLKDLLIRMLVKYKDQRSSSDELIQLIESREHDDHYEEKLSYSDLFFAVNDWPLSSLPIIKLDYFEGRQSELDRISQIIHEGIKKIVILRSCPGNGKTALALQFGLRFTKEISRLVYIFDANDLEKEMNNFLLHFITKENINRTYSKEETINLIKDKINSRARTEKILLILDDCKSYDLVKDYLGMCLCENLFFLITTRNENFTKDISEIYKYHEIEINLLNQTECKNYLKANLNLNEITITELLNKFKLNGDQRPEILNKLVTYLKLKIESNVSIQQIIKSSENEILNEFKSNLNQSLFETIRIQNRDAWEILKYMAVLNSNFVSLAIFREILNWKDYEKAIEFLTSLSIVKHETKENLPGIKINGNLDRQTSDYLTEEEKNEILKSYSIKLHEYFKNSNQLQEIDFTSRLHTYQFHKLIQKINDCPIIDNEIKSSIQFDFAKFNFYSSQFESAIKLYKDSIEKADKEDLSKAQALNNLARVYSDIGEYDEALIALLQSLEIRKKLDPSEELNLPITLSSIGHVYLKKGEYENAIEHFEESLEQLNSLKYDKELFQLKSIINFDIGLCYFNLKIFEESLKYFLNSLANIDPNQYKEKTEYYLDKAKCLLNIGLAYFKMEFFKVALDYFYDARENFIFAKDLDGIYLINEESISAIEKLKEKLTEQNNIILSKNS